MKRFLFILLFFVGVSAANGQFAQNHAIYLTPELSLGNYIGLDINLNYLYKEKYSFKIGYSGLARIPNSQPDDYSVGIETLFFFGLLRPYDVMETYQVGFGKIYILNNKGTIRANLYIGIGYTTITEPYDWEVMNTILVTNYNWKYKSHHTVSLIINPKIEFPFTRFYGLSASPMVVVNKDRTYFGLGIGHMIGLLKKSRPPQQKVMILRWELCGFNPWCFS